MSRPDYGLIVKVLKAPQGARRGSFGACIAYALKGAHTLDQELIPTNEALLIPDGARGIVVAAQGITSLETAAMEMDIVAERSMAPDPVYHMVIAYRNKPPATIMQSDITASCA